MSAIVLSTHRVAQLLPCDAGREEPAGAASGPRFEPPRSAADLYERLSPVVRRVIRKVLGSDREFEDIAQDAFVRILHGLSSKWPEDLERWAARVTINTVYNTLRRRRYRRFTSWNPHDEPDLVSWRPDEISTRVAGRVERVVSQLPAEQRQLLERRWVGTTMDTLAAEQACSLRTVKRRMQRALHNFDLQVRRDPEVASWLSSHGANDVTFET